MTRTSTWSDRTAPHLDPADMATRARSLIQDAWCSPRRGTDGWVLVGAYRQCLDLLSADRAPDLRAGIDQVSALLDQPDARNAVCHPLVAFAWIADQGWSAQWDALHGRPTRAMARWAAGLDGTAAGLGLIIDAPPRAPHQRRIDLRIDLPRGRVDLRADPQRATDEHTWRENGTGTTMAGNPAQVVRGLAVVPACVPAPARPLYRQLRDAGHTVAEATDTAMATVHVTARTSARAVAR